jgi:hypothetical protein
MAAIGSALVLSFFLALSIQPALNDLFPPTPTDLATNIRIGAGSNDNDDGDIPGVHLFDLGGKTIGYTQGGGDIINKGQEKDIIVTHLELADDAAAQAEYMSVVQGGNNALCISYITVTLPNGLQYSWNGDIGFQCGALWMFGNTTFSSDPTGGIYQPRCAWIDGDDSDGLHTKAIGIHLPSFLASQGRVDQYNANNDVMCKADPRFKLYDTLDVKDPIPYFKSEPFDLTTLIDFDPAQTLNSANWATTPVDTTPIQGLGSRASKPYGNTTTSSGGWNGTRKAPKQSSKHAGKLIKSSIDQHKATDLCGSTTSWGPDFVSLVEGIFCDMNTKKTYPLCTNTTQVACFDAGADKMRLGAGNSRRDAMTRAILPRKVYKTVEQW